MSFGKIPSCFTKMSSFLRLYPLLDDRCGTYQNFPIFLSPSRCSTVDRGTGQPEAGPGVASPSTNGHHLQRGGLAALLISIGRISPTVKKFLVSHHQLQFPDVVNWA